MKFPKKIISGGQTGVDRGALDAAIETGVYHGGCCPKGRRAEDGSIPAVYDLQEHESNAYPPRTEQNIKESAATLILSTGKLRGGTALTKKLVTKHEKPYLVVDISNALLEGDAGVHGAHVCAEEIKRWLQETRPLVLNVAGPRESKHPGIQEATKQVLTTALQAA